MPKNPANFNVDNVRVVKILGGGAHDSKVRLAMFILPMVPVCAPHPLSVCM